MCACSCIGLYWIDFTFNNEMKSIEEIFILFFNKKRVKEDTFKERSSFDWL